MLLCLRTFLLSVVLCAPALGQATTSAPAKLASPSQAAQSQAREQLHRTLAADYAKTTPTDRAALAKKLLEQAVALPDATLRFAALSDATALASGAADIPTAFAAIDTLHQTFAIDPYDLQQQALAQALPITTGRAACITLMQTALDKADHAAAADAFDAALSLARIAEEAANKTMDVTVPASIQPRLTALRKLAAQFAQVKKSLALLEKTPDSKTADNDQTASAHLIIGRFYALYTNRWPLGLPHLAACSDPLLHTLAQDELTHPTPETLITLADRWLTFADTAAGLARSSAQSHARQLLTTAAAAHDQALAKVRDRLALMTPSSTPASTTQPATSPAANVVHLLKIIDPSQDSAQGAWSQLNGELVCGASSYACLQLPYAPPEEFDLRAEFTRTEGQGPVALLLATHKRSFGFILDIKGKARFERVDEKIAKDNPTVTDASISNGHRYTLTVQIRKDTVKALLNDKPIVEWKTDYKDLSRYSVWKLGDTALCGVGANSAKVTFHAIDLIEVTGKGKPIR